MTSQRIAAEQNDVGGEKQCPYANAKVSCSRRVGEPHRFPCIVREKNQKDQREVKEGAMNVLDDQRK